MLLYFLTLVSLAVLLRHNQQLIDPLIGVYSCPFVVRRSPSRMSLIGPSRLVPRWFQASGAFGEQASA